MVSAPVNEIFTTDQLFMVSNRIFVWISANHYCVSESWYQHGL